MNFLVKPMEAIFEFIHNYVMLLFSDPGTSYGVTIILVTLLVRMIIFPLSYKSTKSSVKMAAIGPKIKEVQAKYKNNPQKANEEVMKLYKSEGANPMAGCLPLLIQMPIIFALFGVFNNLEGINGVSFLWLKDLNAPDALYILPLLSGVTSFLIGKITPMSAMSNDPAQQGQQKTMNIVMTVMMVVFTIKIKSALALYWVVGNIIQVIQNLFMIWLFKREKNNNGVDNVKL